MNTKAPAVDITQGYASRAFLGRDEYQAIVGTPQFRTARAAQARKLPEAQGKEDYAEFLAISIVDYPMAQISEKLKSYAAGDYSPSFSKFLASKYGLSPTASLPAPATLPSNTQSRAVDASADLWADVIAEVNAAQNGAKK